QLQQLLAGTVWASGCQSWYMNKRGQNTTLWPDLTVTYRKVTRRVNMADYTIERAGELKATSAPSAKNPA
ncbi:MAG TPA: hypothetical protein VGB67_17810, partial [Fibrella sp.]